jgi:hypothetical protein
MTTSCLLQSISNSNGEEVKNDNANVSGMVFYIYHGNVTLSSLQEFLFHSDVHVRCLFAHARTTKLGRGRSQRGWGWTDLSLFGKETWASGGHSMVGADGSGVAGAVVESRWA